MYHKLHRLDKDIYCKNVTAGGSVMCVWYLRHHLNGEHFRTQANGLQEKEEIKVSLITRFFSWITYEVFTICLLVSAYKNTAPQH